jgi:hypothetical protein
MIELETCVAMQSWLNIEYRRGLSTHPCEAPVLRISVAEVFSLPSPSGVGLDLVAQGGDQTQDPEFSDEPGGHHGVEG